MGALIRAYDWSRTPLGEPGTWPASLRATVRLMLNTRHPMFIWWGPDLIQLYNDAYRETMGPEMHPMALGARGRESWAAIWPIIGPQIELVMAGEGSTWNVEQMVPINRHGGVQEVWWTYGYSPIDLDGGVGGVLVVCTDVTQQHLTTEALRESTKRLARQFESAPGFIAVLRGPEHVFELTNASYRRLIGNRDDVVGRTIREALPDIAGQGFYELLDQVYQSGRTYVGRRTPITLQTEGSTPRRSSSSTSCISPSSRPTAKSPAYSSRART
jgi:PAS domain-containing protein